jgi:hypothetical protein
MAPAINNVSGARVDGQGSAIVMQTNRTIPTTSSGRIYKAFWYVPSLKRWAKSVEEYYNSNSVRTERYSDELESDKLVN